MKSKFLLIITTFFLGFCPSYVLSTEIHAILFMDTHDFFIGSSVEADKKTVFNLLEMTSNMTGAPLNLQVFTGKEISPENLFAAIENMAIQPDDTIIFYFSGHGFRTESKDNPWPNLVLGPYDVGVDFFNVVMKLKSKNPRFLLAITDSCNSYIAEEYSPPIINGQYLNNNTVTDNFRKLFIEAQGMIIISSSMPGQYSYGYSNGGLFTNQFNENLIKGLMHDSNVDWKKIINKTKTDLIKSQELQYFMN